MKVKTFDGIVMEVNSRQVEKAYLLSNLKTLPASEEPIDILVSSSVLQIIDDFMHRDKHVLKRKYNPLEIHFSAETLEYFDNKSTQDVLAICNAANYLEYPYLLEVCCKVLATRLNQNSMKVKNEILGDTRMSDEDMERIVNDFDWINEDI